MKTRSLATFLLLFFATVAIAGEADWPQWRGPQRDGHAAPQALLQEWPEGGPELAWKAENLGTGYSAVSVVDDFVYTMGTKEGQSNVICLKLGDGQSVWQTSLGRAGDRGDYNVGWGDGQRATPTVDGDQVFALSDVGVLAALDKKTGQLQWKVDLVADFGGSIPKWGFSESPLIDGDRVLATPGGKQFIVGLDRKTGKKIYATKDFESESQYVSIIKADIDGKSIYVTAGVPGVLAFDAQTGEKVFDDNATGNRVAVIPTPIVAGNLLYHTSAYGAGNTLLRLSSEGDEISAESVYALQSKTMENHHGGVVLVDGTIYGFSKQSGGTWMAQDLETGEVLWQERARPDKSGSISFADNRLYCYGDKGGTVTLVEPSRSQFLSKGVLTLPEQTTIPRKSGAIWAHPVIANGKLIIRDQDLMYAFDIAR